MIEDTIRLNNPRLPEYVYALLVESVKEHLKVNNITVTEWVANQPKDDRNDLEKWVDTNKLMGEEMPLITESLKDLMSPKDLITLNNLPNEVELFRAMSVREFEFMQKTETVVKQSWTTSKDIASFFLTHGATSRGKVVVNIVIPKESILGYIDSRDECECIVKLNQRFIKLY